MTVPVRTRRPSPARTPTRTPTPARRASDRQGLTGLTDAAGPASPARAAQVGPLIHPWPDAPATLHEALVARPTPMTSPALPHDGRSDPASAASPSPWTACGLPQDRQARVAAARALIELQQAFRQAIGLLDGLPYRRQLQRQVDLARDPADLWLLRRSVLPPLQALGSCAERAIWQLEHSIARSVSQHAPPMA
ncbi:MAG: hypothetical protein RIQ53_3890 [Pseudomonadota bacterium]